MSQQIRVLQCVECHLYQVDIVKKANKWECKVCHFKQMVKREMFRGTGAECRAKVQQLNLEYGQRKQARKESELLQPDRNEETDSPLIASSTRRERTSNKWDDYVNEPIAQVQAAQRKHSMEGQQDEIENVSSNKRSNSSIKRKAQAQVKDSVVKKKSSKWQDFV